MTRIPLALAAGLGLSLIAGLAQAQNAPQAGDWVFRAGVAQVMFDSSARFTLAGAAVSGGDAELSDNTTLALEADYYLRPNWSLSLTVGAPPTTEATGKGSLAALGKLGEVRCGPGVVLAKYHFGADGRFDPWVGAGVTRMVVFDETDGSIQNIKVRPAWGGAVQAGAEYRLSERWGAYASVSHLFLETKGRGTFAGAPVTAKIEMNPTILQAGLALHY